MADLKDYLEELHENMRHFISKDIFAGRHVILFGANTASSEMIACLQAHSIPVFCIVDNNREVSGMKLKEISISHPEEVDKDILSQSIVLIASKYFPAMKSQLMGLGCREENIYAVINWGACKTGQDDFDIAVKDIRRGEKIYQSILEQFGKDCHIIICPYKGLGDIYFTASYLHAYAREKQIDSYVFTTVGNACYRVAKMFPLPNSIMLTQEESDSLVHYASFLGLENTNASLISHDILHWGIMNEFNKTARLDWGTLFRQAILHTGDAQKQPPVPQNEQPWEEARLFCEENGILKGKSVILAPYANTVVGITEKTWQDIIHFFDAKSYRLFTNSIGEKEPVLPGTNAVCFPLEIAREVIEYAGVFIGIRSGLCDIVEAADAQVFVLYPQGRNLFFNMTAMGFGEKVHEIVCSDGDMVKRLEELL